MKCPARTRVEKHIVLGACCGIYPSVSPQLLLVSSFMVDSKRTASPNRDREWHGRIHRIAMDHHAESRLFSPLTP
jgi:hypothetical protein